MNSLKRRILMAGFLGTTFLVPQPAQAGPVVAWVAGALGVSAAAATTVGIAATSAAFVAGSAFAATVFGGLLIKALVSVGLSYLMNGGGKSSSPPPSALMGNYAQAKSYAQRVYGLTRKGGPLGFTAKGGARRYYVPILAAHPIERVVEHWLDERSVLLSSESDPDVSNIQTTDSANYGRIDAFTGAPDQLANQGLVDTFPEFTEAHDFKGLAGGVVWAARPEPSVHTKVYPTGQPWSWAPVIEGCNAIYDPRDQSTGYYNNAGLVIADWIVNVLGRGVDWAEVAEEAEASDRSVIGADGVERPIWTINGTISDEQDFEDQRNQIALSCDAFIYERPDGLVGFKVGRWIEPDLTLTSSDFLDFQFSMGNWGAASPDEVTVTYVEPSNGWRETPSGTWAHRVVAKPVRDEPEIYLINNHLQAARMARRVARMRNAKYQIRGRLRSIGYELVGQRFFRLRHLGIDEYFEIGELARESVGVWSLVANSVDPGDFDLPIDEPAQPSYSQVENDETIPAPDGLTATVKEGGSILFEWSEQDAAYIQEIRFRPVGDTYWMTVQSGEKVVRMSLSGFEDGGNIEVQIRNRSDGNGVSDWGPDDPVVVSVIHDPVAPVALVSFGASVSGGDVVLTCVAPNDSHYAGVRFYRAATANFAAASAIHTEYGAANASDTYTDAAPGVGPFTYWAEPLNASGVPGPLSDPVTVTVTA